MQTRIRKVWDEGLAIREYEHEQFCALQEELEEERREQEERWSRYELDGCNGVDCCFRAFGKGTDEVAFCTAFGYAQCGKWELAFNRMPCQLEVSKERLS